MSLYQKLCKALQDNDIDELGLLPLIPEVIDLPLESRIYYPLVVVESKLGIELSALATLIKECHEHYVIAPKDDKQQIEQITKSMILLKPDNYTAMNRRKELISSGFIDPREELRLIDLIFTLPKHSKSSIAWYHRQWIFNNCADRVSMDFSTEFSLCTKATALYPRNYYAWTYRYWVLEQTKHSTNIVKEEYQYTYNWITTNISDFSGFHYLQQVMKILPNLHHEKHMKWLDDLIVKYPGHESLWCHRRFCSSLFYNFPEYNKAQHKFVADINEDRFDHESFSNNPEDISNQKNLAMKFGLWQIYIEKKNQLHTDKSLEEYYCKVAPTTQFLDLQESQSKG